ncbi:MAG: transcriptional regulator, partial [Terriglobales bacterium]
MIPKAMSVKLLITFVLSLACATSLWAGQWAVIGPDGGDVRSLAYDPHNPDRIFLGTSTGVIFVSNNGGQDWSRFAHLGTGDDYVLDHIAVDPQNSNIMYVSAWTAQSQQAGDMFRTSDGGKTWQTLLGMHGKSIRAMAMSASNPNVLVTGALDGVFRSQDGGKNWERMSPANHAQIKNIESIAIDPKDPNVVYAGTWHLAWKTADGGANWQHINKGMIDDSDVFSIIVDHSNPSNVFASACSGIYKSATAGEQFSKIQGIPFSARRTRVLHQDPSNPNIVYAGTTEGLWKTMDLGKTWKRVSNPEVVVNDVLVDPRNSNRVLLATDRSGVLASSNGAGTWSASNHGYTHRYVTAIVADQKDANTIYVGVVNDREFGGVFASRDGGQHWQQKSSGLGGKDVFTLKQAGSGALVAGTNHGTYLLERNGSEWRPINNVVVEKTSFRTMKKGTKKTQVATKTSTRSVLDARVNDLEIAGERWIAATSNGLYFSKDQGKVWMGGPVLGEKDFVSVRSKGETVIAAARTNVYVSSDNGATFTEHSLKQYVTAIRGVAITPDAHIFVASREGAFESGDAGSNWAHVLTGLPDKDITSVLYDASGRRLLATSLQTGVIFQSSDSGRTWQRGPDSGYPLRRVSVVHGRFMG